MKKFLKVAAKEYKKNQIETMSNTLGLTKSYNKKTYSKKNGTFFITLISSVLLLALIIGLIILYQYDLLIFLNDLTYFLILLLVDIAFGISLFLFIKLNFIKKTDNSTFDATYYM